MVERKNQILVKMACSILQAKDLLTKFWAKVVYCENYLLNLILTCVVSPMTPIEKWCAKKDSVDQLRKFICFAWAHIFDACRKKLDVKSDACIMII